LSEWTVYRIDDEALQQLAAVAPSPSQSATGDPRLG
jgi:hypothetical protein